MGEKNTELESQIKDTKKTNSYLEVYSKTVLFLQ